MRCPHCGKEIPDQSHYCLYCMKSLEKQVTVQPAPVSRRPGKWVLLSAAGVLVLAVALGGWLAVVRPFSQQQVLQSAETLSSDSVGTDSSVLGGEEQQGDGEKTTIGEYVSADTGGRVFDADSIERLPGADQDGFLIEDGVLIQYSGNDTVVEIPEGVQEIGERAFMDNSHIQQVVLPEGLVSIGTSAFYGCTGLEKIELPSTLSQVDSQAFSMCQSLKEHVLSVDNQYFTVQDGVLYNRDMTVLNSYPAGKQETEFVIPDTVTMLVGWAFEGNSSLEKVTVPAGVSDIFCPFGYCASLREIEVAKENVFFVSQDGVMFSSDEQTLLFYPPNKPGERFDIPETVTDIEVNAFLGNQHLTCITVPEGVTALKTFVFKEARKLDELYLPSTITMIDSLAFFNSYAQMTIYTPENSVIEDFCQENRIFCQIINS